MNKHKLTFDSVIGIFNIFCPIVNDRSSLAQKPKFCPICGEKLEDPEATEAAPD